MKGNALIAPWVTAVTRWWTAALRFAEDLPGWLMLLACLLVLVRIAAYYSTHEPYVGGDLQMMMAVAVSFDDPALFSNDYAYKYAERFGPESPVLRHLLLAGKAATGSFYTGIRIFATIMALTFCSGVFALTHRLSRSAVVAFVAALGLTLVPLSIQSELFKWGNLWIMYPENAFLARNLFGALTPWLLLLTLWATPFPKRWIGCVAVNMFVSTFVHPVSAPAWCSAIAMMLILSAEPTIGFWRRIPFVALGGVVGSVLILPYLIQWFSSVASGFGSQMQAGEDLAFYVGVWEDWVGAEYLRPNLMLIGHLDSFASLNNAIVWLPILTGSIVWFWKSREINFSPALRRWCGFALGVVLGAYLLPLVLQFYAEASNRLPFQVDASRGLRFLLLPSLFWFMESGSTFAIEHEGVRNGSIGRRNLLKTGVVVLSLLPIVLQLTLRRLSTQEAPSPEATASVVAPGGFLLYANTQPSAAVVQAVLDLTTPQDIFIGPLWLRYESGRSIAYSHKDGGTVFYYNKDGIGEWLRRKEFFESISTRPLLENLELAAAEFGVTKALVHASTLSTEKAGSLKVLYKDSSLALIDVSPHGLPIPDDPVPSR